MPTYRLHDHAGVLANGREALVTARVEAEPGPLAALLEVVISPDIVPIVS